MLLQRAAENYNLERVELLELDFTIWNGWMRRTSENRPHLTKGKNVLFLGQSIAFSMAPGTINMIVNMISV